ncbi:hypothetical protein [Brevundimonas sp. SL161]|uniref:hypothetical protein n=1 Tax=Brevundimonas sp. SL161 TaxID=2804613 RepID=UPI003CE72E77
MNDAERLAYAAQMRRAFARNRHTPGGRLYWRQLHFNALYASRRARAEAGK